MNRFDAIRLKCLIGHKRDLEEFIYARGHGLAPRQTGLTHAREQLAIINAKITELER